MRTRKSNRRQRGVRPRTVRRFAAAATVAVAVFALVELWNGRQARHARSKTANVRISAIAYALRRQLWSWLQIAKGKGNEHHRLTQVQGQFDPAEDRITDLLALAAEAPPNIQVYLREAYVWFYRATQTINEQLFQITQTSGFEGYSLDPSQWPSWRKTSRTASATSTA